MTKELTHLLEIRRDLSSKIEALSEVSSLNPEKAEWARGLAFACRRLDADIEQFSKKLLALETIQGNA